MYGIWLGIPLGFLTFLYFANQWVPFFHDFQTGTIAAAAAGLCVWFFCRGIDVLNDSKLDNPPAFDSHESMPLVLGKINEFLREAQFGPYTWQVRTLNQEETRILATMKFQEILPAFLPGAPTQLDRLILLDVYVDPKENARTALSDEEKPGTQVTLKWRVDSPVHRTQANQIITETTSKFQEMVGAKAIEVRKAPHPLMPPQWLLAVLVCALVFGFMKRDEFIKRENAATEAKAQAEQTFKDKQEQIQKQWQQYQQQQQQNGFGVSPNNPFAPQLVSPPAIQPAITPTVQPTIPPFAQPNDVGPYGRLIDRGGTSGAPLTPEPGSGKSGNGSYGWLYNNPAAGTTTNKDY